MRSNKFIYILFTAILAVNFISSEAQVKVTDGAVLTMDQNSLLELESTNKGLLIPRIAINNLTLPAPLTAPVPAGMLVYSTGGTVPNGFYYWNATSWTSFSTVSGIPVTKSASVTLLKTETVVLATGNITITLPVVTVADDGLQITVKNVGTYTDLVTVVPEAGKTIDNTAASLLTRWVGRTYMATGSNWIEKDKNTRPDNQYEVSQLGSFITIAEVVAFLNAHMTGPSVVKLGGGTYHIAATQNINLPYPVTIEGISTGESLIVADAAVSGTPLFICQTECYFKMLIVNAISNAAGNDAIHFTGSGISYELKDCDFTGFNKGIVSTTNNDLWLFENEFFNCAGAGIEIATGTANGGLLKMSTNDFTRCAVGINLLSGVAETISIMNCIFYNTISGTDKAIVYNPATFTAFNSMFIANNAWNNQGTFISGFDFSRSDARDANVQLINNAGAPNENPQCRVNLVNNASTTTITNALTFYKANWINTSSYTTKWTIGDNRITYQPDNSLNAWAVITGDVSVDGNGRTLSIAIVKNGAVISPFGITAMRIATSGAPYQFSSVIYLPNIIKNDYLELYVTSSSSGDLVTFNDVQWFTNTQ